MRAVSEAPRYERSGPPLWMVLLGLGVIVVGMAFLARQRYVASEQHFRVAQGEFDALGKTATVEACIDAVLTWRRRCTADGPLCHDGIPRMMHHCLAGQDRTAACQGLDLSSASAQWVFRSCRDRGTACQKSGKCPCADAYRALDSFCRHGQRGVAM